MCFCSPIVFCDNCQNWRFCNEQIMVASYRYQTPGLFYIHDKQTNKTAKNDIHRTQSGEKERSNNFPVLTQRFPALKLCLNLLVPLSKERVKIQVGKGRETLIRLWNSSWLTKALSQSKQEIGEWIRCQEVFFFGAYSVITENNQTSEKSVIKGVINCPCSSQDGIRISRPPLPGPVFNKRSF